MKALFSLFVFSASAAWAGSSSSEAGDGLLPTRMGQPARLEIVTAEGVSSYRSPVRVFTTSVQREFHATLGFPYPETGSHPLRIEIGFPQPFAMDVTHRIYRMPSGQVRAVVVIPDPPTADFDSIRLAIDSALFKTALYSRAKRTDAVTQPPTWFLRGLSLHTDPQARLRLFETAHGYWSHAKLPAVELLFATNSPAAQNPAVAAQVAAWCVNRDALAPCWERLLGHLAKGGAWNASLLGEVFRDVASLPDLDDDFNRWFSARGHHILSIGSTGTTILRHLRSRLLIYPWESDIDYSLRDFPAKGISLAVCLKHADRPEVRSILEDRIQDFHLMAIGRDPLFQALCNRYITALRKALEPGGGKKALSLWKEAEDSRLDLEARLAAGEILK